MRKLLFLSSAVLLSLFVAGCQTSGSITQIDSKEFATIDSSVAPDIQSYQGIWKGKWDGRWDTVIIVTNVHADGKAEMVYRWVERPGEGYTQQKGPAVIRHGVFTAGSLKLRIDPNDKNKAHGSVGTKDTTRESDFVRVQPSAEDAAPATPAKQ